MSEHKQNPFARGTRVDLPAVVRDLYGRVLAEGDKILLNTPQVPVLHVITAMAPAVDPKLPANTMEIILTCKHRFIAVRDQANPEFVLVIAKDEQAVPPAEPPRSTAERES